MKAKNHISALESAANETLSLMGTSAKASVEFDKEGDTYVVNIESSEETGLLIGKKGENLSSLQLLLAVILKNKTGEWKRVLVNVGDYREKEESYLKDLAESAVARAKETGQPQNLYNLKAWQRRIVHMFLSENKDVVTESEGEGENRYLVIKPAK